MTTIRLIAGREITTRWQQKGFRIGLAVAVVIVALRRWRPGWSGPGRQHDHGRRVRDERHSSCLGGKSDSVGPEPEGQRRGDIPGRRNDQGREGRLGRRNRR
jgi:hypothetical protein